MGSTGASRRWGAARALAETEIPGCPAVAEDIRDHSIRARALTEVARALDRTGDAEDARSALIAARAVADSMEHERPRARALTDIAEALAEMGEVEVARSTLTAARAAADGIRDGATGAHQ
jgi:hypothetical protein